jgi:hypothetical protein
MSAAPTSLEAACRLVKAPTIRTRRFISTCTRSRGWWHRRLRQWALGKAMWASTSSSASHSISATLQDGGASPPRPPPAAPRPVRSRLGGTKMRESSPPPRPRMTWTPGPGRSSGNGRRSAVSRPPWALPPGLGAIPGGRQRPPASPQAAPGPPSPAGTPAQAAYSSVGPTSSPNTPAPRPPSPPGPAPGHERENPLPLPHPQVGGLEPEVGVAGPAGSLALALHLPVQSGAGARDAALAHPLKPQSRDQPLPLAAAHPQHIGLPHHGQRRPPRPPGFQKGEASSA